MSSLYLTLWKQLDQAVGDNKWFEIRTAEPADLRQRAEEILTKLRPHLLPDREPTSDMVAKDFKKTQEFAAGATEVEGKALDSFKDYLRENALRYSELAAGE